MAGPVAAVDDAEVDAAAGTMDAAAEDTADMVGTEDDASSRGSEPSRYFHCFAEYKHL